jgi:pyruvate ferredoxin oxidoreductase gamma subunit
MMLDTSKVIEIRWHGRGGQGVVTSAGLVAEAAINEGKYAQAFPSFGPERRGAPVAAFVRISSKEPIRVRSEILTPDVAVVFDVRLIETADATSGLKGNGLLVLNANKPISELERELDNKWELAVVDASKIAVETLGIPIVNTTMVGALIKATSIIKLESLFEPLRRRFGRLADRNIEAMKRAYEETIVKTRVK